MADFTLKTSTSSKGYSADYQGYSKCWNDIVVAARRGEAVDIDYSSLQNVEDMAGPLPKDVRSTLGLQ